MYFPVSSGAARVQVEPGGPADSERLLNGLHFAGLGIGEHEGGNSYSEKTVQIFHH